MKIGELSRRSGLTVRTLRHYHEIGLLVPSFHAPGDHRVYDASQLARLQQILSLRALGLPLEEIGEVLDRSEGSLLETVERHLARLDEELARARKLRARLTHVADSLRASGDIAPEDWIATIQETVMFEKYYSEEQLETLRKRREEVGQGRIDAVQQEWADLFAELGKAQAEGVDPGSARAQELARRADALVDEFTGGDAGIRQSLTEMYAAEGGSEVVENHGMDVPPGAWEFLGRARAASESTD